MAFHGFIAGTDTDVGKTFVSEALLQAAKRKGLSTAGFKPVSAGCELTPKGLRNADALALQSASSMPLSYTQVNPIAFADPVAPHLAAQRLGQTINLDTIVTGYRALEAMSPDVLLMEGAGGWRLPLNQQNTFLSDVVKQLQLPVLLVVGMKLGCLNHALLTVEAIKADGLELSGWVANQVDPDMDYFDDNVTALKGLIDAPCLGVIPRLSNPADAINQLSGNLFK